MGNAAGGGGSCGGRLLPGATGHALAVESRHGDGDAGAAPADLVRARARLGRADRRPTRPARPRHERDRAAAVVLQALRQPLPRMELPRELPTTNAPAMAVLAGTAEVEPAELDLPQLSRLLHLAAGVVRTVERPYGTWLFRAAGSAGSRSPFEVYVAVPEGGALPAGVHWYHPEDHALLQVGPPPRARRADDRRHRHPVAHRLALPRARLPAHLLGRGHDARAAARRRRLGRARRLALHPLPGSGGHGARRRRRRARVARGRRGVRRAGARGDRRGRRRRGGRGAGRVPARDRGPAGRRCRRARRAVGARRAGRGARVRLGPGRAGGPRAKLAAADGPDQEPGEQRRPQRARRLAARGRRPPLRRRECRRRDRARHLPLARPLDAAPRRQLPARALPRGPRPGPRRAMPPSS